MTGEIGDVYGGMIQRYSYIKGVVVLLLGRGGSLIDHFFGRESSLLPQQC